MRVVKWVFGLLVLAVAALFLSYVLPKREVVYVTQTYTRIVEPGEFRGIRALSGVEAGAAGQGAGQSVVDVFFVDTVRRDGGVLVFRNEDTGFGFPPYFKFDSATLQGEAQNEVSTREDPTWVVARYYGWRVPFLSMFPNLTSLAAAPGPDVTLIPWTSIVVVALLVALLWAIWARLRRWSRRRADPVAASWEVPVPRRGWFGR
jgi:hypothetical protein